MKKYYSILWIDDDPSSIKTSKKIISKHLLDVGIIADINYFNPLGHQGEYTSNDIVLSCLQDPELDMVLMDYNLGDQRGSDIISFIRNSDIYVPIIYYSQQHYEALKSSLLDDNVDGVFISTRSDLENRVKRILDSLMKKEQSIRRIRGLLLSDTSELEALGENLTRRCWNLLNESQKRIIKDKFSKYISKSFNKNKKKIEQFDFNFEDISNVWDNRLFDSSKKGYFLQKILEQMNLIDHMNNVKKLCGHSQHNIHVFSKRNEFAHHTEEDLTTVINHVPNNNFHIKLRNELHQVERNMKSLMHDIEQLEQSTQE